MTYRVLVVEDELVAGEANVAYLTRLGLEVVGLARSGREALRILDEGGDVDLLLLDMHLPDGHGLSLLRQLRAHAIRADVIAVTSARDIDVVRRAVAEGVVSYLIKPFSYAAFRGKIEHYLAYRARLDSQTGTLGQSEVDAVLAALRPVLSAQPLPKGLAAETLELVSQQLRQHGPISAGALGVLIGASRVTSRRYLEHLANAGLADRTPRYGNTGRPELEYTWR